MNGLLLALLVGCTGGKTPPEPAAPIEVDAAVVKALSAHDGVDCEAVDGMVAEPQPQLLAIVQQVERPSNVPMRAAGCLIERHAASSADAFVEWVSTDNTRGLALLLFNRLADLPEDIRTEVEAAGRKGPYAVDMSGK